MNQTLEHSTLAQSENFEYALLEIEAAPNLDFQIEAVCARVPPLWPLENFVAVNPFVGLSDRAFTDACGVVRCNLHGEMMMPLDYYQQQWSMGNIADADFESALEHARQTLSAGDVALMKEISVADLAIYNGSTPGLGNTTLTVADWLDLQHDGRWRAFITDEVSKWCAAYYDRGQASWRMPWREESLFDAWKNAAIYDATPKMMGLSGFGKTIQNLPQEPYAVIAAALETLQVPNEKTTDFLHRQLMTISGWSGYVQYLARENKLYNRPGDALPDLLAIRLAYDVALYNHHENLQSQWAENVSAPIQNNATSQKSLLQNYLWQLAAELKYQRELVAKIKSAPSPALPARPDVQAIFCIDVRSEVFRRALESTSEKIETIGFAGFFGFAIECVAFGSENGSPQCPVLLTPGFRIHEKPAGASPTQIENDLQTRVSSTQLGRAWNAFKTSAVSCFSFVETGGLLSGAKLVKDTLHTPHREYSHDEMKPCLDGEENSGMNLDEQISVAVGALKNMGLTKNLARIVMICGHGSHTTNNPYGAGLDCGACGGNSGETNARVAAMVLNNEKVRAGLQEKGILVPEDTRFLAALHNTTTDEITLFDAEEIPQSHRSDLVALQNILKIASHQTRQMRASSLDLSGLTPAAIDSSIETRSHDWAQTRPEWGLAGNAAFIAAPRSRTQNVDLSGRAFLNNYDFSSDTDGSILELVMCAPMVVASWINLQYFASTVNNKLFGSGNKTIHNVVGAMGVWEGNHGDLQVGLPLQSVHDGEKWMHEPLRLSVFIEAPRAAISQVISKHESVRELVDNGWIHLFAIEENGQSFVRYMGNLQWQETE